ncbi:MAG: serine hydrolase [Gammaproteobacteria bacterium]|nr:serine hydrolase [Gammaproteobacteria bacterium]
MATSKLLSQALLLLIALCGVNLLLTAETLNLATPEEVGLSADALQRVTERLQQHVDEGEIAGVVAAVARDGKLVYYEALGQLNREQKLPMPRDALFRVYSMTRQVTSLAVLQLYEQGAFELNDPVTSYLPQFTEQKVLIEPQSTDISQVRQRNGDITIAHLLTHTSGLGSRNSRLYREQEVRDRNISLDQMVNNAARIPLFHDPGTSFRYGIHATILGKLVEVWSGQSFEDYLQKNILEPLEMHSTMFWASGDNQRRLAELYQPTEGQLLPHRIEAVPWTQRPILIEGGVGLLSSVMDYVNFSQMILNNGVFEGRQILQPETATLIFENAVPRQAMPIGESGYWRGSGWTLGGFNLVLDPETYSWPVSTGTIWWDGSAGTRYFIDPQQNLIMVIMAQVSPSQGGGFRENFSRLVDAAIMERR